MIYDEFFLIRRVRNLDHLFPPPPIYSTTFFCTKQVMEISQNCLVQIMEFSVVVPAFVRHRVSSTDGSWIAGQHNCRYFFSLNCLSTCCSWKQTTCMVKVIGFVAYLVRLASGSCITKYYEFLERLEWIWWSRVRLRSWSPLIVMFLRRLFYILTTIRFRSLQTFARRRWTHTADHKRDL